MAAPRKPENRALPENLYRHPRGFRYRRPDGTYCYLGKDRDKAVEAAKSANLFYSPKTNLYDKIIGGEAQTVGQFLGEYIAKRLPKQEVEEDTRKNREYILKKIQGSSIASLLMEEVSTRDLHQYLETLSSDWIRQSYRAQLIQAFKWAIRTGVREDNPALITERANAKRARSRLTFDEFKVIREHAPHWLQNCMDLGLQTLQRPGDVVMMRWDAVTEKGLRIEQQKTGRRLEIELSGPLKTLLTRCRNNVVSPFIIHRLPEKARPQHLRAKHRAHFTQVLLEQAERAFDETRKASKLYEKNPNPPTLHEIRSLGAALYREAGWPEGKVQLLLGHTEIQMTRHYLAGHEAPWEPVAAGLYVSLS